MSNKSKAARKVLRGSSEKGDEKLKGRIRELAKEVEKWKRYSAHLEKQLTHTPEQLQEIKLSKKQKKKDKELEIKKSACDGCENCGSDNTKPGELWTPTGIRHFITCEDCPHKKWLTNVK